MATLGPALTAAAINAPTRPLDQITLRSPVVNPSKIIACASNYRAHVEEMHQVQQRTLGGVEAWMMDFGIFLKAPSSITGPNDDIVLPAAELDAGHEIHHESELVVVVGTGGRDIPRKRALAHVAGYTIGLDITVRSAADRSRRKSYDTFSPIGPWLTTADEVGDPAGLRILLTCNGVVRQDIHTSQMITDVASIVAYASHFMRLESGDVIFTGAPPGVGPLQPDDSLHTSITTLGHMQNRVRRSQ